MTTLLTDPFAARFGKPLPSALRADALGMSWASFVESYSPASGPISFGAWSANPGPGGRRTFEATFGVSDTIRTSVATTFGPIEALTDMLYDAGFPIEILAFHQQPVAETGGSSETATFVQCEHGGRRTWSMAINESSAESGVRAVMSAANMLHC